MPDARMPADAAARLPPDVRRLVALRAARSLGQGAQVAAFSLYLHVLGWSAAAIGATLSAALLVGAALTLAVGPSSDRIGGRRRFLLAYEGIQAGAALLALATTQPALLALAAVLGGFGRGANGSAGPFGPLEQAWLALRLPPAQRGRVFSINTAVGFAGMAVGAAATALIGLAATPPWQQMAYRGIFLLTLLGALAGLALLAGLRELPPATSGPAGGAAPSPDPARRAAENRDLRRLVAVNALNGLGIGMVGPLIAYWFLLRFGHGPDRIGPALAASFVLAAAGALLAGRLAQRHGLVRVVVGMRLAGLVLLLAIPLMPGFALAAACYALRAGMNQGTAGVRQAVVAGLTGDDRRGFAASLQNVSVQIPRALGPVLAGLMLHAGWLTAPFLLAALCQAGYLLLYARFFGGGDDRPGPA
ncbi:MFS transporter [Thermomonas flagellata]|uniref:MFS transporter n=1 Tax=Thermomonas flagellata TaxID=2888524 RepID=UPI001F0461D3|nr:MFS transporter [Thermomonas flagellata]